MAGKRRRSLDSALRVLQEETNGLAQSPELSAVQNAVVVLHTLARYEGLILLPRCVTTVIIDITRSNLQKERIRVSN